MNWGQKANAATLGKKSGAMMPRSISATTAAPHSAQNRETVEWTSAADANKTRGPESAGTSMAPAAHVASSGSEPVTSAHTVDGTPLNAVATAHA